MKCLELNCNNEIENKTGRKKFCSNSCKMKHFRKNGNKNLVKPINIQSLINQLSEKIESIDKLVIEKIYGMNIQDLTKPTNQIKAITEPKDTSNVTYTVKEQIKPNLSPFDAYKSDLKDSNTVSDIEMVMKEAKIEPNLSPREKLMLESYAKELSKEMYTD